MRNITSIHVQGEETAIFAADRTSRHLQLYRVVIPDGAIASDEQLYGRNKRRQTVGIEIVRGVGA